MEIIIKLEPFTLQQTVFIKHENGTIERKELPQKELASFISLQKNVTKVHCFGNEKFVSKLEETCISKYKLNNIDFCINC